MDCQDASYSSDSCASSSSVSYSFFQTKLYYFIVLPGNLLKRKLKRTGTGNGKLKVKTLKVPGSGKEKNIPVLYVVIVYLIVNSVDICNGTMDLKKKHRFKHKRYLY